VSPSPPFVLSEASAFSNGRVRGVNYLCTGGRSNCRRSDAKSKDERRSGQPLTRLPAVARTAEAGEPSVHPGALNLAYHLSMIATLEDVVERLRQAYDPVSIVLFGSRARGDGRPDSDADLLIVKDTPRRPIDRRIEVERILLDRTFPLDVLVYTPDEVWRLYLLGSPLVQDAVDSGRLLYMRRTTEAWLRDVDEELAMAELLGTHRLLRGACLHAQQSVEKALKALLLERGHRPPRTHDLVPLLQEVRAAGWTVDIPSDGLVLLNSVYRGRYPTDEGLLPRGEPTEEDANSALHAAREFRARVGRVLAP
jgi:HEPN domain-containing protein/predicted nucleotidyltransferase